ncbi:MAG: hypothetical protein ABI590_04115 [Ilumatobacteraceae bacterium]
MNNLEARLADLAGALNVDSVGLVDSIVVRIDQLPVERRARRRLQMVAAFLLIVATAIALHPDSRRVVARWFGLDLVRIERDADLELSPAPETFVLPGPGESEVIDLDGRQVLMSAIAGRIDGPVLQKTLGSSTSIVEVEVGGHMGLWISGAPHELLYESSDGVVTVERIAGNTLLWEVDEVLYRLEGFDNLEDALNFAGTRMPTAVSD